MDYWPRRSRFAQVFVEKEEDRLLAWQVFAQVFGRKWIVGMAGVCAGVCREGRTWIIGLAGVWG